MFMAEGRHDESGHGTEQGLRERKKRETFLRIVAAARRLVDERGLDGTTVEAIAAEAGISNRTFFNYFACKEDAVVGSDPQFSRRKADELRNRPADETPVRALKAMLFDNPDADEAMLARWLERSELVRRHPELMPRHLLAFDRVNREFTEAVAGRMGVDPARDPRPAILVSATIAAVRTTLAWWQQSDRSRSLVAELETTFALLETIDLRGTP